MNALKKANIGLNRKMLSEIAAADFNTFKSIFQKVQG
jgi:ribosomal protein L20